jgi:hypothetical protein
MLVIIWERTELDKFWYFLGGWDNDKWEGEEHLPICILGLHKA